MKDAKTIAEFVEDVFSKYSLCYTAYFYDYNENDEHVPAPIFEDDIVTPSSSYSIHASLSYAPRARHSVPVPMLFTNGTEGSNSLVSS